MKVKTTLNGHVLIRPRAADPVAGIEIPDSVDKETPTIGEVIIGNDVRVSTVDSRDSIRELYRIAVGAIVLFSAFKPRKVTHDGEELLLVNGEDIYAILEV